MPAYDLERFVTAQSDSYAAALAELEAGKKQSHWMWFIFPQLAALGRSDTAKFYGISSLDEARAYLEHSLLGPRLRQCIDAVLPWAGRRNAEQIFGGVDAMKLRSCLTLFHRAEPDGLFFSALGDFFAGERDERTLALLDAQQ